MCLATGQRIGDVLEMKWTDIRPIDGTVGVDLVQNKKWLYNLNEDPTEQINLIKSDLKKLNELEKILNKKLSEQVKPIWPSLLDWPIFIDKTLDETVNKNDEYIFWAN